MRRLNTLVLTSLALFGVSGLVSGRLIGSTVEVLSNVPPRVEMSFPARQWSTFAPQMQVRLEATADDPDGKVQFVQFFVGTNLVGTATKPPYSAVWSTPRLYAGALEQTVSAMATDDLGAITWSAPVPLRVLWGIQLGSVVVVTSPNDGDVLPAPATFEFAIEIVAGCLGCPGDRPAEFLVGTNLTKASPEKPFSITVTNLEEGEYRLQALYYNLFTQSPAPIRIRVGRVGLSGPSRTEAGELAFGGFNTVADAVTVVETSTDLFRWMPVLTNRTAVRSFYLVNRETSAVARFYRLVAQPP